MTGIEENSYIGVPVIGEFQRPALEARFRFRELGDDRIEVHHPFHAVSILGDASAIPDKYVDAAAVVLFREMPFLIDSMKLNRPRRFETRPFAGEYSQLSHCFSLGLLAVDFLGGPMDVLDGLYNDASQTYGGHKDDDQFQGHGKENLHDDARATFLQKSGIIDKLIDAGAFRRESSGIYVGNSRLTIDRLLSEDEVTIRRSFMSNKHPARRLDEDRFQYNEEERFLIHWAANMDKPDPGRIPKALAELSLNTIARRIVLDDDEGEQLVFTDDHAALNASKDYVRHNAEHWNEPVQDLVNDLLNLADRYFFICSHPHAKNFQYFFPHDYLHTSASFWYEQLDIVAEDDAVMAWFLNAAEAIARDQQTKSLTYYNGSAIYSGPQPSENITMQPLQHKGSGDYFAVVDDCFVIELPKGKKRTINPRILNGGSQTVQLTDVHTDFVDFAKESNRWVGDYKAYIQIEDAQLRSHVRDALVRIQEEWPKLLAARPSMPPLELQRGIKDANDYVRKYGRIAI